MRLFFITFCVGSGLHAYNQVRKGCTDDLISFLYRRIDSDSENDVESEDDMQDPYPLEGKYKDEADKRECVHFTGF